MPNLIVSRKEGERVVIGDSIVVTVERLNRKKVRLRIRAPSDVKILREELLERGPADDREPNHAD